MIALDRRYLADRGEGSGFCPTCGQSLAKASDYLAADAIADYRLELGDARVSGDAIAGRLKHVSDFLALPDRLNTTCADAGGQLFATAFRAWSKEQPATWKNKAGEVTVSRPRSAAATEESLTALRAVLNHAVESERSDKRPTFKTIGRKRVSSPRRVRCDVSVIADMLAYAAEPKKRRGALHGFIIGSLCTLARPDAVTDISTAANRRQWWKGSPTLDLNPAGREQTKKHRATVPVLPLLNAWLSAIAADPKSGGWLVNYYGKPVQDVDSSWDAMLKALGLPMDREWKSYLLRHSLATMMRDRNADHWELSGFMGHRLPGTTETYAVGRLYPSVSGALNDIIGEIGLRAPEALHRTCTGEPQKVVALGVVKNG